MKIKLILGKSVSHRISILVSKDMWVSINSLVNDPVYKLVDKLTYKPVIGFTRHSVWDLIEETGRK
jgi:hypothetical protein